MVDDLDDNALDAIADLAEAVLESYRCSRCGSLDIDPESGHFEEDVCNDCGYAFYSEE